MTLVVSRGRVGTSCGFFATFWRFSFPSRSGYGMNRLLNVPLRWNLRHTCDVG
jgi:hypothetical protein